VEYVCSLPASFLASLSLSSSPCALRSSFSLILPRVLVCSIFFLPFSPFLLSSPIFLSLFSPLAANRFQRRNVAARTPERRENVPLTAYTNPGCLNSLANYFHSVSLFPCISRYQSACERKRERAAASFGKVESRFLALISETMSGA
jgi:hypothetical protein